MRTKSEILGEMSEIAFFSRGYNDFKFFVERIFNIKLEDRLVDLVDEVERNDHVAVMAFTGAGKTLVLGELYTLWKLIYNKNYSVLIISNSMDQSTKLLRRIKERMTDNEITSSLVPAIKDKWSETEIVTSNRGHIFCKPLTPNVKGVHVNYLLADEVAEYKDEDLFNGSVLTRVTANENTKIAAISTPVAENDLIHKLMENPSFKPIILKAEEKKGGIRVPTCPVRFPLGKLDSILRMIGRYAYAREYLLDCTSVGDKAVFDIKKLVDGFDRELDFDREGKETDEEGMRFIGADFAMSARGDYFSAVAIKVSKGKVTIMNMEHQRGLMQEDQEGVLVEWNEKYKPNMMIIDSTHVGSIMKDHLIQLGLPIVAQGFTPRERLDILNNLRRIIENGQLKIPRHEDAEPFTDILFNEISSFVEKETPSGMRTYKATTAHDDTVISLSMACKFVTATMTELEETETVEKKNEEPKLLSQNDMWII